MSDLVIIAEDVLYSGKFLTLKKLHFRDRRGRECTWEAAQRVHTGGAAVLIPKLVPSGKYLLIRQFRPPTGKCVIEFPAGLIDPGETAEATAIRELYEETGYRGRVTRMLPWCSSSPGMTGESFATAFMEIDETQYPEPPEQHLEDSEDIERFAVAPADVPAFLAEARARGDAIDAKVEYFFALAQA